MADNDSAIYDQACNDVHEYILAATKGFETENIKDARLVRKKVSVFTYGVCVAVAEKVILDKDELYFRYLLKGGLKIHQARVVVERTSLEFIKKDYAKGCFDAGYQLVTDKDSKININSQYFRELFSEK